MKDNKNKFSPFELSIKPGVDISYPDIKKNWFDTVTS